MAVRKTLTIQELIRETKRTKKSYQRKLRRYQKEYEEPTRSARMFAKMPLKHTDKELRVLIGKYEDGLERLDDVLWKLQRN